MKSIMDYPNINDKRPLGISPALRRYSAYLIDDSSTVRAMLKQILLSEKFVLAGEAENGEIAVNVLSAMKEKPDYIFCDIDMPHLNGIETVKQLRPIMSSSDIIMCTSHGEKEIVVALLKMGVKGYIQKPFDRTKVLERLNDIVANNPKD